MPGETPVAGEGRDFIRQQIAEDLAAGRCPHGVVTRFPPEPNGYLHIGHAKSMCLNFGVAEEFGGRCFLRFDDTNPGKESREFVEAIKADVRWLGFDWGERLTHASDYFERLYEIAEDLVRRGHAYVDSQSAEQIRAARGTLTEPGRDSPYRDRPPAESLELLRRMRAGEFPEGAHVLRARIDMGSPNLNLRDPVMYRILHQPHPLTGTRWCIYPMYDFAHGQCDALEGVTHSLCTLEFEDHRALYDWFVETIGFAHRPRQYEFSRLNLTYTVMSKRLLSRLVAEGHVSGWDDPRMPTLQGLRRRGYTPAAIRDFCARVGVTRKDNLIDVAVLENCVRQDLEGKAPRRLGVLRPLRLVIETLPEGHREELEVPNHPADPAMGTRRVPFARELLVERDDFMEDPPRKFHRLAPGREVRLRYAYLVTCTSVVRDPKSGEVIEVRCRHDPGSRGGSAPDGRKVRGTIHWVSERDALRAEVRLYDRLFRVESPAGCADLAEALNPDSLERLAGCALEPALAGARPGEPYQLERLGYFCLDEPAFAAGERVFNRTVALRDSWARRRG